jgi:hypothetical protein
MADLFGNPDPMHTPALFAAPPARVAFTQPAPIAPPAPKPAPPAPTQQTRRQWPPPWHGATAADKRIARQYNADNTPGMF